MKNNTIRYFRDYIVVGDCVTATIGMEMYEKKFISYWNLADDIECCDNFDICNSLLREYIDDNGCVWYEVGRSYYPEIDESKLEEDGLPF